MIDNIDEAWAVEMARAMPFTVENLMRAAATLQEAGITPTLSLMKSLCDAALLGRMDIAKAAQVMADTKKAVAR